MVHQSDPLRIARPCDVFREKSGRMSAASAPVYGHAGERGGPGDGVFRRGRPDLSEELANAIVFMASDEGSSGRSPLSGDLSSESGGRATTNAERPRPLSARSERARRATLCIDAVAARPLIPRRPPRRCA